MKKFIFVLMPFNEQFDDVYKLGIKAACQSEKVYCERVDEQYYEGSMLDRIYNQIQHADYIIADMSTKNPNVFYEVGFAHALQKRVILITQEENDIPFDLKHFYHIIYSKNKLSVLNENIKDRIDWYLSSDDAFDKSPKFDLQIYVNGNLMCKNQRNIIDIDLEHTSSSNHGRISIVLKNNMSKVFRGKNMETSIIFFDTFPVNILNFVNTQILPDNKRLLLLYRLDKDLLPKSYLGRNIDFNFYDSQQYIGKNYEGEIVVNTPFSQEIYPFNFVFNKPGKQ